MDRTRLNNPYTPGAGTFPPELAGREAELEQFDLLVGRLKRGRSEQSMIITGMRGVGKTVLLTEFERRALAEEWLPDVTEVENDTLLRPLMARRCRSLLLELSRLKRMGDRVRRALGVLKAFTLAAEGVELRIDVDPLFGSADSGNLSEDLRDLLLEVAQTAAAADTGAVFLFDELQLLQQRELEALILALHRVDQRTLPLAFVGAGLPLIPRLTGEAKSYAERMFIFPRIGALEDSEARRALSEPATQEEVTWSDEALDLVLDESDRYPYFLQEFGREAWNQGKGATITRDEVEEALPHVQRKLDESFFEVRLGRLTLAEKRYVLAMANLGDGPQHTTAIADSLGAEPSGVSPTRDQLLKANLVYSPRRGYLDFTVPHSADYVRRVIAEDPELTS